MKQIWPIIGVACVMISSIGRMANSLTDVLIAVGAIAVVALVIWLFETGRLTINERLGKVLKKICSFILVAVGIAYLVAMAVLLHTKWRRREICRELCFGYRNRGIRHFMVYQQMAQTVGEIPENFYVQRQDTTWRLEDARKVFPDI